MPFDHLETTAGVDMESWSRLALKGVSADEAPCWVQADSPSMPVQPVRVGFETMR